MNPASALCPKLKTWLLNWFVKTSQEQLFRVLQNIAAQLPAAPSPVATGNPSLHLTLPLQHDGDP